jgi:hypothetical protein
MSKNTRTYRPFNGDTVVLNELKNNGFFVFKHIDLSGRSFGGHGRWYERQQISIWRRASGNKTRLGEGSFARQGGFAKKERRAQEWSL